MKSLDQTLLTLSDDLKSLKSGEDYWNRCLQAFENIGIAGIGYGVIPFPTEIKLYGATSATVFRHSYSKEWEKTLGQNAVLDNDISIDLIEIGQSETLWHAAPQWDENEFSYERNTEFEKQFEIENDLGMQFGATLLLSNPIKGSSYVGLGLHTSMRREAEFTPYWDAHRRHLTQIGHLLDMGMRIHHNDTLIKLSGRERDCLSYLAIGLRPADIAHLLNISEKTLEKHISGAKLKLKARTRDHAVAKALMLNLIQP